MHPLLFEIPVLGGIRIYTYGVLVAAGFVIGILWTVHEAKIAGVHPDRVMDLAFYIVIAALVGSRVLYIFGDWERYAQHPLDLIKIWEGGLVFYGGLIGAAIVSFFYLKRHHLSFLRIADLFMPGVVLGHAIGRIGCLAAGCCYGKEMPGFLLATVFPQAPYSLAPAGIPLFPNQIVESLSAFLIFFVLVSLRRRKKFEGQIFLTYLVLYSIVRMVLEPFRASSSRSFLFLPWVSIAQLISAGLVLFSIIVYVRLRRQQQQT